MSRDAPDSLDRDVTRPGRSHTPQAGRERSLGDQSTTGDQVSSLSDLTGDADSVDQVVEITDLAARYDIEGPVGRGGMGEVLKAVDRRLQRSVAIKRIRGELAKSPKALARFLREARAVAALNHFNIVQVHDYGRDQEGPFIIMELVEGPSLQEKLRDGPLNQDEAIEIACQLCDGLSVAHERGIIHRDIKPANVLLTLRGEPKLTDFGLARQNQADYGHTMTGAVLGTVDFMAPEQRRDATQADARSDLWSLGATLYQTLTGRSPRVIRLDLVADALRSVLGKALEEVPAERYQTVQEFRDALRRCVKQPVQLPTPEDSLGSGECPECHTINSPNRKFCQECAASLTVTCLGCGVTIPAWDKVCGECGAKQAELLAARRSEIDEERQRAESLRREYQYAEALAIAEKYQEEPDQHLRDLRDWAVRFIGKIRNEHAKQEQLASAQYAQAKERAAAHDYAAGIQALESIAEPLRTQPMRALLAQLQSWDEEWRSLDRMVQARVKTRDLSGLLGPVSRLLELRPDRADVAKLKSQLERQQRQAAVKYSDAEQHASACDYAAGIRVLQSIPERQRTEQMRSLLADLQSREAEWRSLDAKVRARVEERNVEGLLDPVNRLLELRPDRADVAALQARLQERLAAERDGIAKQQRLAAEEARQWRVIVRLVLVSVLLAFVGGAVAIAHRQYQHIRAERAEQERMEQERIAAERAEQERILALSPITNSIGMQLKLIPAGEFLREGQRVRITQPFYLGVHEVTREQYKRVTGAITDRYKGPQHPVVWVSWEDAVEFCAKLSALSEEQAAGRTYRLPTEAEWEYACRAGSTTAYCFGDNASGLGDYAWYSENSSPGGTHPVGQKRANAWGLHDMHGNVWEWCSDWYAGYPRGEITDPQGPSAGVKRVYRGGGWHGYETGCQSAARSEYQPARGDALGFRVVAVHPADPLSISYLNRAVDEAGVVHPPRS